MPIITVNERLSSPIDEVWKLVENISAYPQFMEPVKKLNVLEEEGCFLTAEWEVELKGSLLKWIEREEKIAEEFRINFQQLSGDLECFEGYWQLNKVSETETEAILSVNFEIGIPMLRDMLNPVAERALRDNAIKMLRSLERIAA